VKPVIGLCTAMERARWGVWDDEAVLLPRAYVSRVTATGGIPVLLAPDPAITAEPDTVLGLVDGLVLAGGADVDPSAYGAEPDPRTLGTVPERDAFELALMRRAFELDLPVLGVCRGMQVMNVARGGTLIQHLPDSVGHEDHRRTPGSYDDADHDVELVPGSLAGRAAGEARHSTKSHHHQGVDRLGEGLRAVAWAPDGTVEAVEGTDLDRLVLGVQWHAEGLIDRIEQLGLFAALVEHAERRIEISRAA
jgi:putative glutamine amidotransferase